MIPFVTYEDRIWNAQPSVFYVPRRTREQPGTNYRSAVILDLSRFDFRLDPHIQNLVQDTIEQLAKLDGFVKAKSLSFPMLLLRTESLSSSQIEHLRSSNRNVALAQLNLGTNPQAKIISANLKSLVGALYDTQSMELNDLKNIHHALLSDFDPTEAGQIRTVQNWIGRSQVSPLGADYVPPHPDRLPEALDQLFRFIRRTDMHPLVVAALSHAYFESIHPFADGNGRTGRVLIQMILRQTGFLEQLHIPISAGLVKDPDRYVKALTVFREGDYQPIIEVVCHAALNVVPKTYDALAKLDDMKLRWKGIIKARSDAHVWMILDEIVAQPVVDAGYLVNRLKLNDQAVRNNIDILFQAGILTKVKPDAKRNVAYESKEVLAVLDEFTATL